MPEPDEPTVPKSGGDRAGNLRFPMERPDAPFDPPPEYARLRAEEPVADATLADGRKVLLISRYDDVKSTLRDPRVSSDLRKPGCPVPGGGPPLPEGAPHPCFRTDPPEHTIYKKLLLPDFTVRKVNGMKPRIREIVRGVLDDMAGAGGPVDLNAAVAVPVPSLVICELLGVPYADHEFFQERTAVPLNRSSTPVEVKAAMTDLWDYLARLLAVKRADPGDDILSKLAASQAEERDAVASAIAVLNGGHETTVNMISLGTAVLLERPGVLAELRADPGLWPGAVDELLRYLSIGDLSVARAALDTMEIGGRTVHAGEGMFLLVGAANRDADAFPDPDEFDVRRPRHRHIAFGHGMHQCIGQHLARAELEIVFAELFGRFPGLRLAVPASELSFKKDSHVYGLRSLPVEW
ncbi:cytochrome P450 [Spirillospora sp. NPDC052242]